MKTFNLYEQKTPIRRDQEYIANFIPMGKVTAKTVEDAMKVGRLKVRWPVLHEVDHRGNEIDP